MLDIFIQIDVNRKSDIDEVIRILKEQNIDNPVYIVEFETGYYINFNSDYHYDEIDEEFLTVFSNHEFVEDLGKGKKDIKLQICRTQSPFSSDDWSRSLNTDPIKTQKYLIKKASKKEIAEEPKPTFKVLFGDTEKEYSLNIVPGFNKGTNEEGFLLIKQIENPTLEDILINKLFKNKSNAFWEGFEMLSNEIEEEFKAYKKNRKHKNKKK